MPDTVPFCKLCGTIRHALVESKAIPDPTCAPQYVCLNFRECAIRMKRARTQVAYTGRR